MSALFSTLCTILHSTEVHCNMLCKLYSTALQYTSLYSSRCAAVHCSLLGKLSSTGQNTMHCSLILQCMPQNSGPYSLTLVDAVRKHLYAASVRYVWQLLGLGRAVRSNDTLYIKSLMKIQTVRDYRKIQN